MNRKIPVAHLTDIHPADDTRIYHKECLTLAQSKFQVLLIAPHQGRSFPGVTFLPIRNIPSRFGRIILGPLRVLRRALQADAEIYHLHDPELIPIGLILKLLRKRVIYDAHEDLPSQVAHKSYLTRRMKTVATTIAKGLCWAVGKQFDGIIAATPRIAERFPVGRTWVVRNYPRLEELSPGEGSRPLGERACCAIYVGGLAESRGLMEMMEAAALLGPRLSFRLLLAGKFESEALESKAKVHPGWAFTEFMGWLDRPGIAAALARARCGLVPLHPTPAYLDSLPVKLFEYMASGLPVIASRFPLWEELLDDKVQFVEPCDGPALAEALEALLQAEDAGHFMAAQATSEVQSAFNWESEAQSLLACYETVSGFQG